MSLLTDLNFNSVVDIPCIAGLPLHALEVDNGCLEGREKNSRLPYLVPVFSGQPCFLPVVRDSSEVAKLYQGPA